jgi:transcriptional regulator with XRE-family HTH domain
MLVGILRKYQEAEGLTQSEFARRLGITTAAVSYIFNDQRNVGIDVVRAFLRAFPQASAEIAAALAAPAEVEDAPAPLALVG